MNEHIKIALVIVGLQHDMFHGIGELVTEKEVVALAGRLIELERFYAHCKKSHSLPDLCCPDVN